MLVVKFEEWANVMHVVNVLTFPAHGSVMHESQCGKHTLPDYTDMYE